MTRSCLVSFDAPSAVSAITIPTIMQVEIVLPSNIFDILASAFLL